LVFYPANEKKRLQNEEILQISDWRDENTGSIMRSLKRRNEWYAIQKGSVQSWGEAIVKGHFSDKVQMEWGRMPGADVSDIYYNRILMHGQPVRTFEKYRKGDSVRLRIVNGGAATYFWLQYSGGKMRVIAADGNDVKPVEVDKMLIASAETYDVIIKIPDDGQYEFRATAQDITKSASAFFGTGQQVKVKDIPRLDYMVLMNEMNRMTWSMKGAGMKMKMGLSMKMPEMSMNNMGGMSGMEGMDMNNMNGMPMDHSNMNMNNINGVDMKSMDSMKMDKGMDMKGMDMNNMDSSGKKMNMDMDRDMNGMNHNNMPGMNMGTGTKKTSAKKPAQKKARAKTSIDMKGMNMKGMDHSSMPGMNMGTGTKKTSAKKTAQKNAPAKKTMDMKGIDMKGMDHSSMPGMNMGSGTKKTSTKKPAPKKPVQQKPAPKKKMDMPGMKMGFNNNQNNISHSLFSFASHTSSTLQDNSLTYTSSAEERFEPEDTTKKKKKNPSTTTGHENMQHDMGNMDSMPSANNPPTNMKGMNKMNMKGGMGSMNMSGGMQGGMNMGGMQGGMQSGGMQSGGTQRDTSRSYMLQSMMPKMPMQVMIFPPGNGKDVVLSYDMLRSDTGTTLPSTRPWREISLTLSGNMQRYIWSINGQTLSEQDEKVLIRKGENIRLVFTNATMMEHPMHLHGHFFRVINNQSGYAPMKHTFNINPMATQVIEFAATEEKDWFLHCHILYHMAAGMATVISYEGTESAVQKAYNLKKFKREHGSQLFPWADAAVHSQGTFGNLFLSGRKFQINHDWRWNYKKSYDVETRFQYYLDKRQFFSVFAGAEFSANDVKNGKQLPALTRENVATLGLIYTLPFLVDAEGRIDHNGKFRFQLRREDIAITTRARLDFYWNTDKEYGINAKYIIAKYLAVSANYDNQYGWGAGLSLVY